MGVNSEKYEECFPHKSRPTLQWAYIKVGAAAAKLWRNLRIVTSPTACYEYFCWSQWLILGLLIRFLWEDDECDKIVSSTMCRVKTDLVGEKPELWNISRLHMCLKHTALKNKNHRRHNHKSSSIAIIDHNQLLFSEISISKLTLTKITVIIQIGNYLKEI